MPNYICDHAETCEKEGCHWHRPRRTVSWISSFCSTAETVVVMMPIADGKTIKAWPKPQDMSDKELVAEVSLHISELYKMAVGPRLLGKQHMIKVHGRRLGRVWPTLARRLGLEV